MTTALSSLALILTIIRFALFIRLHTVESPYSPVRHAVSDYAVGPTRRLATATTWLTSATWLALAGAAHGLRGWDYSGAATVLLLILAAIFAILPAFPTTLEGQRLTPMGAAHYALAIGWFAIAFSLAGNIRRLIAPEGGVLAAAANGLYYAALVSLVVLMCAMLPRFRNRYFGLPERAYLVSIGLFYAVFATAILATGGEF